jgi:hypothetical protein
MSKIIVNTIQSVGGSELILPTADGTAGQYISTDGSGQLSFVDAPDPVVSPVRAKGFALAGSANTDAGNQIMWTDIMSGVAADDIIQVRISGYVRSTTNFQCRAIGLNSSGTPITTGYLGYGREEYYNGETENLNTSHNSNQGHIWWSTYTTAYGTNSDSYGNGMMFEYTMMPRKLGTTGGHFHKINYTYQQDTSYDYPNHGTVAWSNYSTSAPPETWHGVAIYPSSGSWDDANSRVMVELLVHEA